MNQSLPPDVLDQIAREILHFDNAPAAFLQAWKRGVHIAGAEWFQLLFAGSNCHQSNLRRSEP